MPWIRRTWGRKLHSAGFLRHRNRVAAPSRTVANASLRRDARFRQGQSALRRRAGVRRAGRLRRRRRQHAKADRGGRASASRARPSGTPASKSGAHRARGRRPAGSEQLPRAGLDPSRRGRRARQGGGSRGRRGSALGRRSEGRAGSRWQAVEKSAKQARHASAHPGARAASRSAATARSRFPTDVPEVVQKVVAGANEIADFPYVFGGGHASFVDNAYDCSGSVSYALAAGGLLSSPETSGELESWGAPGPGRYITVYANAGHTYMYVDGILYDTAGRSGVYASRWLVGGHRQQRLRRAPLPGAVGEWLRRDSPRSRSRSTANRPSRDNTGLASSPLVSIVFGYVLLVRACGTSSSARRRAPARQGLRLKRPGAASAGERDRAEHRRRRARRRGVADDQAQHQRRAVACA